MVDGYFWYCKFEDRNFLQLSSGEQRLVLLARAFVKDPELLILDETFAWVGLVQPPVGERCDRNFLPS